MIRSSTFRLSTMLMVSASGLSLAAPALAQELLFASNPDAEIAVGQRQTQTQGLTQIRLNNGATLSILDRADYRINADGFVDLYGGSITVAGGDGEVIVRMPEGVTGEVSGTGSAASFSVADDGEGRGHVLTGTARVGRGDNQRRFSEGEMFAFSADERLRQVVSNGAQATPDGSGSDAGQQLAELGDGGPVAAAQNGLPVTLGDALAAAGASSDIVEAARRVDAGFANPAVETFPSGDLGLLIAGAAGLENAFGGTPFTGAQADIIRTYLSFLADGGAGSEFLSAYASFLGDYLDLIRSGAAPSSFDAASLAEINSFITFSGRTNGFASLGASDRALVDAYLAFLLDGGNPDLFAGTFTDLTNAYFAFVRAGGDPGDFTGGSQATLDEYIAFLASSGLVQQLSAENRALVDAYLANGGLAFADQYRAALNAYSTFLASGGLPSNYGVVDQATLRAYLETLEDTGLLDTVTGEQADFYTDYLAFLRAGGDVDGFASLPVNIFTGYASELDAYFAFLDGGGLPSAYTAEQLEVLNSYLAQLAAAGALDRFLGAQADFFADYLAFLQGGGQIDTFAQLNANIFAGYASALADYYAYLENGGVPSAYGPLTQEVISDYLAALAATGATDSFLADLAAFYSDYFAFVTGGGNPDNFAGLPVPPDFPAFASALNAYALFLSGGGLPSDYTAEDLAILQNYLDAIVSSGQLADLLGANADLLTSYFTFLASGGAVDGFAGLPVYGDYVTALNAYYSFLSGGGLPGDYTAVDLATLEAYLAALNSAGGLAAFTNLNGFFADYFLFVSGGGDPAQFAGLPIYGDYVAALNAYLTFLADGGLPSDYTVLDQATLQAYLEALAALDGGLAAFGTLDGFFIDFYAFLLGGGNADQFAGLPVNGGTIGGPRLVYQGGFTPTGTGIIAAGSWADDGRDPITDAYRRDLRQLGPGSNDAVLDADGGLERYVFAPSNFVYADRGTAQVTDINGDEDLLIGRWTDGTYQRANGRGDLFSYTLTANQGFHYLIASGFDGPANYPTGRVYYDLLGATAPTLIDGSQAPGEFEAQAAIIFGANPAFAIEGSIIFADFIYTFASAGGVDGDGAAIFLPNTGTGSLGYFNVNVPGSRGANYQGRINFEVQIPDAEASKFGVLYNANDFDLTNPSDQISIIGAAIFGARDGQGSSGTDPIVRANQNLAFANLFIGDDAVSAGSVTVDDQGRIIGYQSRDREIFELGTAEIVESGEAAGVTWTRWADGTPGGDYYGTTSFAPLGVNGGWHVIAGDALVNMPSSGTVTYDLVGFTTPTRSGEGSSTGSVSGSAVVQFGATPLFGLDMTVTSGMDQINLATEGGVSDVSQSRLSIGTDGVFSSRAFNPEIVTTNIAGSFCANGCLGFVQGFLSGDGATGAGLSYAIRQENESPQGFINGTAAFQAGTTSGGGGTGGGNTGSGFTGVRNNIAYYTYLNGSLNQGFGGSATLSNGQLTRMDSIIGSVDVNNASIVEAGDNGTLAWARWADGQVQSDGLFGATTLDIAATGGYHVMAGETTTTLPTSGTVTYNQIGGTSATDDQGSAPGTLTGNLAIAFGTVSRVGYDFTMDVGGKSWAVSTNGGAANPGSSDINLVVGSGIWTFGGTYTSTSGTVTAGGDACAASCIVTISGTMFGENAQFAGVAMNVTDVGSVATGASGLAIFGSQTQYNPYLFSAPTIAPSAAPVAVAPAWDRWTVPATARGTENGFDGHSIAPGTPGMAVVSRTPVEAADAERMLGGMILFPASR